jgi:hypothetical protein
MAKLSPEDRELLEVSAMFRRGAYGEDEPKTYPFAGVQIWLSGFMAGGFIIWLFMR